MARITPVPVEKAEGIIKTGYQVMKEKIGIIPKPMEMLSASPGMFEFHLKRAEYFSKHPTLSFALLAHIRYLVALNLDYSFCTDFNGFILKKLGLTDDDIRILDSDISGSMLEENEKAMLTFVAKSVKAPQSVTDADIEGLRDLGWNDRDMVDALSQGVSMIDHSIMMQVFDMDQRCMIE